MRKADQRYEIIVKTLKDRTAKRLVLSEFDTKQLFERLDIQCLEKLSMRQLSPDLACCVTTFSGIALLFFVAILLQTV